MSGTMLVLGKPQKNKKWDTERPETVEESKAQFDQLIKEGYSAYAGPSATEGKKYKTFDPEAREMVMVSPPVGG